MTQQTTDEKRAGAEGGAALAFATDLVGQTLGDYMILRRLGQGGMAEVYLAEQLTLKRKVAIKVLKPELGNNPGYVDRFVREAQAAAALVQANIVQIYEICERHGYHFIVQEYIPGRNLKQYITRNGAVSIPMVINILRQTALALQKAAEQGVIHRDIKPENIMISTSGEVKVTDFGLARIVNDTQRLDLTQVGVTMGTPLYMSPEQVQGQAVDPRTDIYSLGVTAFHMLAGHPPFSGENALAVAIQQVNSPPPDLRSLRPDAPVELIALIERMLAKSPADRIQDPAELLRALRTIQVDQPDNWDLVIESIVAMEGNGHRDRTAGRLAATRKLQQVLNGNLPASRWQWLTYLVVGLLSLTAAAAGVALAVLQPIPNPLEVAESPMAFIPKKDSAEEQYREAQWIGLPEFYQAVLEYFPADQAEPSKRSTTLLYNRLAMQRLGEIYLRLAEPDYERAFPYFDTLSDVDDAAPEFQAAGFVGLAIIAHHYGDEWTMFTCIMEAHKHRELLNEFLRGWFDRLVEELQKRPRRNTERSLYPWQPPKRLG